MLCSKLRGSAFRSVAIRRKDYRPRHLRNGIRITLWHAFIRRKRHFCSEWQWLWQSHRWLYWHKIHTVDWQYELSTYCTCIAQVYGQSQWVTTEPLHINNGPSALGVLTARQGKQALSMSQIKRFYISHNRHRLTQCKRIRCHAYSAKNKEKRTKFKCRECNISLCATSCFEVYHTKMHFRGSTGTKMDEQNIQISVNTTTEVTELIFFSTVFLMK